MNMIAYFFFRREDHPPLLARAASCALRCLVRPEPPRSVAMSPQVDALAPSGLSLAEQSARRSAASVGVSPASSTALELAPASSKATHAALCPLTAAQ